jgi:disulfide bond formation protein DsbB
MIACFRNTASCNFTVLTGIIGASAGALFAAFYSQFALGLEPCHLCLLQRMPFIAAIILGLIGLALIKNQKVVKVIIALCAIAFLIDAGIAFFHTGVERKWWQMEDGCPVPDFSKDPSLIEKMLTSPAAQCDQIAWKDPFLGLSMANYNVMFCLALFAGCVFALACRRKPA